jgi:hypothetical protein
MFFIPYALFEVPSNIALKLVRPSIWIPIIMLSWGTVMTKVALRDSGMSSLTTISLMGLAQSYAGLVVTRVILGITEVGFSMTPISFLKRP